MLPGSRNLTGPLSLLSRDLFLDELSAPDRGDTLGLRLNWATLRFWKLGLRLYGELRRLRFFLGLTNEQMWLE